MNNWPKNVLKSKLGINTNIDWEQNIKKTTT